MTTMPELYQGNAASILDAIPHPVLMIGPDNKIEYANQASEEFFRSSVAHICRNRIDQYLPFGSPALPLIEQVRREQSGINEYRIDISSPRLGREKVVDIFGAPFPDDPTYVVLQLLPQSAAAKLDRQMTHRSAARTVIGLAAMLAHEIKNPLSGIRGAAQLLEMAGNIEDRSLTQLIKDETDRIVKLVDRMEVFSDERPLEKTAVNVHSVLEHVKRIGENGFASDIKIVELYDPSLPPVHGNRDQLVQVFLNLLKNAAESVHGRSDGEVTISTGFRPGIHLSIPGAGQRVALPIELCIQDNGPGISDEIRAHIFDPFITTKTNGSGLGLALVAKIVGDHGGMVECESDQEGTTMRILLPVYKQSSHEQMDGIMERDLA